MLLPVAAQYAEVLADWRRLLRHARARGCFLGLNAQPKRLDLIDVHARMAKEEGVFVAINSDAHTVDDFGNLDYGIGQARRGSGGRGRAQHAPAGRAAGIAEARLRPADLASVAFLPRQLVAGLLVERRIGQHHIEAGHRRRPRRRPEMPGRRRC